MTIPSPTTQAKRRPRRAGRIETVLAIPRDGNRIYGNDVPMPWKEAAREAGIPERTFWRLIERREIEVLHHPGRVMVKPSAIRAYLAKQEVKAL